MWETFPTDEYLKPFFWLDLVAAVPLDLVLHFGTVPTILHDHFFISAITSVVQKWNWLSKTDIKLHFTVILFHFNITNTLTNII